MNWRPILRNTTFAAALAGGLLFAGATVPVRADDDMASCHRNIDRWQDRLDRDAQRYGPDSRQANKDRHELDETREACHKKFSDRWRDDDRRDDHDRDRDHNDYDRH